MRLTALQRMGDGMIRARRRRDKHTARLTVTQESMQKQQAHMQPPHVSVDSHMLLCVWVCEGVCVCVSVWHDLAKCIALHCSAEAELAC